MLHLIYTPIPFNFQGSQSRVVTVPVGWVPTHPAHDIPMGRGWGARLGSWAPRGLPVGPIPVWRTTL